MGSKMRPTRRSDQLLVEDLGDETLVYDVSRHKAHCLSRTARLVWERCDGETPVSAIAGALRHEAGMPADERVVWFALGQLDKARLLEGRFTPLDERELCSRRELARRLGVAAALLPFVTSVLAPTAAASASICSGHPPCNAAGSCPPGMKCQSVASTCMCITA
jgi:hypothetical protein